MSLAIRNTYYALPVSPIQGGGLKGRGHHSHLFLCQLTHPPLGYMAGARGPTQSWGEGGVASFSFPPLHSLPWLAKLPHCPLEFPLQHTGRQEAIQDFIQYLAGSQLGNHGPITCREILMAAVISPLAMGIRDS